MRRLTLAAAAFLAATLLAVGCSGPATGEAAGTTRTAAEEPVRGGRLVVGSPFDVGAWNEYVARRDTSVQWLHRIYLPLAIQIDPAIPSADGFEWALAERFDSSEDGRELRFVLRDAVWSDGRPITGEDVAFTWRAQMNDAVPWGGRDSKARLQDVRTDPADPQSVTFVFDESYPFQFADAVEGGILPAHVFGTVPFEEWTTHDWSQARIGSGPFLLTEHRPGDSFVLQRNENYFDPRLPHLDEVVVRIVSEPTVLLTQLRSGEIDLAYQLPPRDADRLRDEPAVSVLSYPYPDVNLIGWNARRPPFDDPRVRKAMTLAINREQLIDQFLFGEGAPTATLVASYTAGANRRLQPLPFDTAGARRLLQQAGYSETNPLSFELVTNVGNALRRDVATSVQAQLAEVGVEVKLTFVESGALNRRLGGGEFDAFLRGLTLTGNPPLGIVFGSNGGFNVVGYESAEVDSWLERLKTMNGWDGMKDALDNVQREVHDDQPFTFLYERRGTAAYGRQVSGFEIDVPSDPLARLDRTWRSGA